MGRGGHSDDEATPYDQSLEELEFMRGACAAAQRGDLRTLRDAVARRPHLLADDGVGGDSGYAPLHYAAREGHAACVSFLLEAGARVDRATKEGRATALHRAAYTGRSDVIAILLRAGADASAPDADGETALHKAAARGAVACVESSSARPRTSRASSIEGRGRRTGADRGRQSARSSGPAAAGEAG